MGAGSHAPATPRHFFPACKVLTWEKPPTGICDFDPARCCRRCYCGAFVFLFLFVLVSGDAVLPRTS